jgi:hypothetical protein
MDADAPGIPISKIVADTLAQLGKPGLCCIRTTVIMRNRFCIGRRFLFDGVQAVWLLAESVIEFHGDDGELLARIDVGKRANEKAA